MSQKQWHEIKANLILYWANIAEAVDGLSTLPYEYNLETHSDIVKGLEAVLVTMRQDLDIAKGLTPPAKPDKEA